MSPYKTLYVPSRYAVFVPINNVCRILARLYRRQLSQNLASCLVSFQHTGIFVYRAEDFLVLSSSVLFLNYLRGRILTCMRFKEFSWYENRVTESAIAFLKCCKACNNELRAPKRQLFKDTCKKVWKMCSILSTAEIFGIKKH